MQGGKVAGRGDGAAFQGKPLKLMFWLTSSIGISKLAVLVRLNRSSLYLRE